MPQPALLAVATAVPAHQHQQIDLHDRWLSPLINSHRAKAIFRAAEINTRHSVFETADFVATEPSAATRNQLYLEHAVPLAEQAIQQVLATAKLTANQIDHIITVSCTGFDTPGIEISLAERLEMPPTLRRTALIGQGCHAGLTALDRAWTIVMARPKSRVLIVAVELCTIHFQHGKKLENMIASALFGDGVGAAVVGSAEAQSAIPKDKKPPRLCHTASYNDYTSRHLMGVHLSDKGFQIWLATKVAKRLRQSVPELVAQFLSEAGIARAQISWWAVHPGGAKILDEVGTALELSETDLRFSRQVLRRYGNMSSATIFFVLAELLTQGQTKPDDYGLILTFGPGLTVELGLLQF